MIGRLWLNMCQICHWRASSLLVMPNGCNVLALFIRWPSRTLLTESRLLRMSSFGIRRTSLIQWPAWLKWSDTGVVVLSCWWFRTERRRSPKRSLGWRLVSPMYWRWHLLHSIRYIRCNHPRCLTCSFLREGQTNYTFFTTNEARKITDSISCHSKNLIYMILFSPWGRFVLQTEI